MSAALTILLTVCLTACASGSAPNIKGRWKPLNGFPEKTEAIPLRQSYKYYPSPMDGTLKAMLTRWAQDSDLTLNVPAPGRFHLA